MKIIANENDIDPYKDLDILNRLYDDSKISNDGFEWFVLREIIYVKKYYRSIFIFKSSRFLKMEQKRFVKNIYSYIDNVVDVKKHVD